MHLDWVLLGSRWLHIMAAMSAVGGMVFLRFALIPAARATLDEAAHAQLRDAIRARWSKVVMAAIAVLLLTGGFNFVYLALPPKINPLPYHPIFGLKLLLALGVFFIASALVGRSPGFAQMRAENKRWLGIALTMAAVIIALSGALSQIRAADPGAAAKKPVTAAVAPQ